MKIDIKHLEDLSKLEIDSSKKQEFEKSLEEIIDFIDEIAKLDLPQTEKKKAVPLSSLRDDKEQVAKDFDPLMNAPKKKDGCFQVPLVVE